MIDQFIIDFIKTNPVSIGIAFAILFALAKESPWTWDEKLLDIIVSPFKTLVDSMSSSKIKK